MGCNCDCYCGLDTRSNRLKFLTSAVLFVACLIVRSLIRKFDQECRDMFHDECREYAGPGTAFSMMKHHDHRTQGRHVPDECVEQWGNMVDCLFIHQRAAVPLQLLFNVLFVGMIVPLGMLCCCTKNPHKKQYAPIPAEAPLVSQPPTDAPKSAMPF